ncbi:MAG: hypothetical protein C0462_07580 [Alcanivorax sp.]|nr:hypothetical protein [Alcanivorax sp.]
MTLLAGVLTAGLWLTALACLLHPRLRHAIVLLQTFFLLLALSWALLGWPWLALAEILLGAGLIGLVCHRGLRRLQREPDA